MPGRLFRGDLEHEMEDIVAMTLRFRTELRAGGAFELRIFTLQPVQRAALHFGFSPLQGGENAPGQLIGVQPVLPIPDQGLVTSGHRHPELRNFTIIWRT